MGSARQQVLHQTLATRQNAEKLLASLLKSQAECDEQLQRERRTDAMRSVTGTSSLERAISQTRRMIEQLDRSVEQMKKELEQEGGTPPAPPPEPPAAAGAPASFDIRVVFGKMRAATR